MGSAVGAFEDAIRAQLQEVTTTPAPVIAERVGWTRGITVFKERIREVRPGHLPPDPASQTTYDAGDIAQCELSFPPVTIPVGYWQWRAPMQLPVLTMVLGYSRWLSAICAVSVAVEVCGSSIDAPSCTSRPAHRGWVAMNPWLRALELRCNPEKVTVCAPSPEELHS